MSIPGLSLVEPVDDGSRRFERTPPHDVLAEQSVLGGMMLSKDAAILVAGMLNAQDFYVPKHTVIYEALEILCDKDAAIDVITVTDQLNKTGDLQRAGGAEYLHSLTMMVPTAANADYYATIVSDRALLRRLVEAGTRIAGLGYKGEGEADDILNQAQSEMFAVTSGDQREDLASFDEVYEATVKEIEDIQRNGGKLRGIPTGLAELDDLTNGFHPGQLIVIAARPGGGKSVLALNFARAAAVHSKFPTVFFSLEMQRNEIMKRLISAEAGISLSRLEKGDVSREEWARMGLVNGERLVDSPLVIDDSANLSLVEIRAKCRRLAQTTGLRMVIIDYLQLMTSSKKVENRQQEVAEFSRALKLLAKELGVPVIALSQLNRLSEQRTNKRPMLSDLRESGSIEQDADIVMLINRDPDPDTRPGESDLIIAKHRNGGTKDLPLIFQGQFAKFSEMAPVFAPGS